MNRVGLIGVTDPRHRWFLAALLRRRAGVSAVGVSEPDTVRRREFAEPYGLASWDDHGDLLAEADPTLAAVALPDPGPVVIDALRHGCDVLVAGPACRTAAELATIRELTASTGKRVTAVHLGRARPAARTAEELVSDGRLGQLELVSLLLSGTEDPERDRQAIADGLDLVRVLTGAARLEVAAADDPAYADDPPELQQAWGDLMLLATAAGERQGDVDGDHQPPVLEVRRRRDPAAGDAVQVAGSAGAVEWDVRTGLLRSALDGREPAMIGCGPLEQPDEWVLNNLLRRPRPVISTEQSLWVAETLLDVTDRLRPVGSVAERGAGAQ